MDVPTSQQAAEFTGGNFQLYATSRHPREKGVSKDALRNADGIRKEACVNAGFRPCQRVHASLLRNPIWRRESLSGPSSRIAPTDFRSRGPFAQENMSRESWDGFPSVHCEDLPRNKFTVTGKVQDHICNIFWTSGFSKRGRSNYAIKRSGSLLTGHHDRAGSYSVDPNVRRKGLGQAPRQHNKPRFGRTIVHVIRPRLKPASDEILMMLPPLPRSMMRAAS